MKFKFIFDVILGLILSSCAAGVGSSGLFGTGVSVALDPRTVGTQIDDSIMQKSIAAKILAKDKKYFLVVKTKEFSIFDNLFSSKDNSFFFSGKKP